MPLLNSLIKESRKSTQFVVCLFCLGLYYYCYRYILQYNSVSTSPTYSDTPQVFKIAKYILLFGIYLYFVIFRSAYTRKYHSKSENLTYFFCVMFNLLVLLSGFLSHNLLQTAQTLSLTILPLLFYHFNFIGVRYKKIMTFLFFFYLFSILYEAVQLLLYVFLDRLPALAYRGTTSIRFGGPWDDPNGWGVALSFFIPLAYFYTKKYKFVLVLLGLMMLLLTQSLTAIGAFALSMLITTYLINKDRRLRFVLIIILCAWLCFLLISTITDHSVFHDFFKAKQGSIEDHMKSTLLFYDFEWYNYIIGNDKPYLFESDIINILGRGGLLLLGVYLILIIKNIVNLLGLIRKKGTATAFWKASLYFQIAFLVASVNLPCSSIFYLFLMFNMILCLSTFCAKEDIILHLQYENCH